MPIHPILYFFNLLARVFLHRNLYLYGRKSDWFMKKRNYSGFVIIVTAAILLELISAVQYYYMRSVLTEELELRAEADLTMKAIVTKSALNLSEKTLQGHLWDLQRDINHPDSMFSIAAWIVKSYPYLSGCGIAFVPNHYPQKGRLFEPYAMRNGERITTHQIAGERHDYTKFGFYKHGAKTQKPSWTDPYHDPITGRQTASYAVPIYDNKGKFIAVFGLDMPLDWLGDTVNHHHIYPSSFVLLLTEGGKLMAAPPRTQVSKKTADDIVRIINDSTIPKEMSRTGRSKMVTFRDANGRDAILFFANFKGKPHWQIAVVCYKDEVFGKLHKAHFIVLLLSMLGLILLGYIIYRTMRNARRLAEVQIEHEHMSSELRIASNIQQALLPANEQTLTGVDDAQIEGRLIPAKAVGGDLYNVFVRDGKLFFCIGDVSGKGIPAALIMAITQTLFRTISSRESNPAHIMQQLNETACRNNKSNMFATMFIGILDLPTGHLRYCNAGHEVPIFIQSAAKEGVTLLDTKPNLPVGIFDNFNYEMQKMVMPPGSTLFLYTDGLTEARNAQEKLFGRERVMQMIKSLHTLNAKQMVEAAVKEVELFAANTEQSDDLTLLTISYTPQEEHFILDETLTLDNNVKEVTTLSAFVKDVLARLDIGKPLAPKLRLALEEAVVNVMEYAYPSGKAGKIGIRVTYSGSRLRFIITDSGIAFNPTEASNADTTLSAEDRPVGGLGILLVRELMDSINYERIDGKNILTMTKKINK